MLAGLGSDSTGCKLQKTPLGHKIVYGQKWTLAAAHWSLLELVTRYFDVRKVCIESILHTDNAQHFTMVSLRSRSLHFKGCP